MWKSLNSEANKKKGLHFIGSIKIGLLSKLIQLCGLMSPDLHSRVMGTCWSDTPIMPSTVYLGMLELVKSRFCNIMHTKMRSADYLKILNNQVIPSADFFSFLVAQAYSKITIHEFIGLKFWKSCSVTRRPFHTWIGHQSPELHPIENLWDMLEKTSCSGPALSSLIQDLGKKLMKH